MKEHNFTPEQSEQILNAVYSLKAWDGHVTSCLKHINDLFVSYLNSFVEKEENGENEVIITGEHLLGVSFKHRMLSDFFFDIEDAIL